MFAIVKILTNVGVSRWIDKEKDEFKRDMEKQSGATYCNVTPLLIEMLKNVFSGDLVVFFFNVYGHEPFTVI